MANVLKLGLPKGSLQESTIAIFKKAGWNFMLSSRNHVPYCDDPEIAADRSLPGVETDAYVDRLVPSFDQDGIQALLHQSPECQCIVESEVVLGYETWCWEVGDDTIWHYLWWLFLGRPTIGSSSAVIRG